MTIYDYILAEETRYNTIPVPVVEGYEWLMSRHVKLTTLYLNSRYETGDQENKPFKQIILPKINLEHRAVQFDVKEIEFFVDDYEEYYKSFLVRKFHQKWARKNDLATFLDELTETYTDYGGVLVKKLKGAVPVVIQFQQLAFVDQTSIMSGPICEKHQYTPDELKDMESAGWGKFGTSIDELITLATNQKSTTQVKGRTIETPNKYIAVYELHGNLPVEYLYPNDEDQATQTGLGDKKYVNQMQIVAYYKDNTGKDQGVTLFRGKEAPGTYKFYKRDPIYGRALGRGGVEELFEPQVWVNYNEIQKKEMLDYAAKQIYKTNDQQFEKRNDTTQVENGQIFVLSDGKELSQVNTQPANVDAFNDALDRWDNTAKEISSSYDSIAGDNPQPGQPFRATALINTEAHSLHRYRKGKIGGQFLPGLYRDWILPEFVKEMTSDDNEFMSNLSLEEMQSIADSVVTCTVNKEITKKILGGYKLGPGEQDSLTQFYTDAFYKKGNKQFFKIFKEEMKDVPIDVEVNITQEETDRSKMSQDLASVFTQIALNPALLDDPRMSKLFNEILELSNLSPLAYTTKKAPLAVVQQSRPQPTVNNSTATVAA